MEEKREEKREEKKKDENKDESVEAQVKEPLLKRFYITMTTKYQMVLTTFKWVSTILCLLTILFSYGVGMANNHTLSQYSIPYVSYLGVQDPERVLFAVGFTVSAALLAFVLFTYQCGMIYLHKKTSMKIVGIFGLIFGILTAIFLSLLSIFNPASFDSAHYAFIFLFFLCSLLYSGFEASALLLYYRIEKTNKRLKNLVSFKFTLVFFHFIFFLVNIISGSLPCNIFLEYFDISDCPSIHLLTAVTQYILFAIILTYITFLRFRKLRAEDQVEQKEVQVENGNMTNYKSPQIPMQKLNSQDSLNVAESRSMISSKSKELMPIPENRQIETPPRSPENIKSYDIFGPPPQFQKGKRLSPEEEGRRAKGKEKEKREQQENRKKIEGKDGLGQTQQLERDQSPQMPYKKKMMKTAKSEELSPSAHLASYHSRSRSHLVDSRDNSTSPSELGSDESRPPSYNPDYEFHERMRKSDSRLISPGSQSPYSPYSSRPYSPYSPRPYSPSALSSVSNNGHSVPRSHSATDLKNSRGYSPQHSMKPQIVYSTPIPQ